jgi:membrane protein
MQNDPLRLAGATAFFATFALPAVLFIMLQITRLVLSRKESNEELFVRLNKYVGSESATHLINVLKGFEKIASNWLAIVAGFLFLVFVATTLFKVIKNSLNDIWNIKVVADKSVGLTFTMRSRELIVILSAGILLLLTLFIEGIQAIASDEFLQRSMLIRLVLNNSISFVIAVIIATIWFGLIFCFLPDGRYPVRIGLTGAFVTSILFNIGKMILKSLLLQSNLNTVFGNAASVVLLLLFIFYSALIFYFGAAYTKALADHSGIKIKPLSHAATYHPI